MNMTLEQFRVWMDGYLGACVASQVVSHKVADRLLSQLATVTEVVPPLQPIVQPQPNLAPWADWRNGMHATVPCGTAKSYVGLSCVPEDGC